MTSGVTYWIYPTNPASDYILLDPDTGAESEVTPEGLLEHIERHPDRVDSWVLTSGFRLMRPGDALWVYAGGNRQEIVALARALQVYEDRNGWKVDLSWDVEATQRLMAAPLARSTYGQIAQSVARANPVTVSVLDKWLKTSGLGLSGLEDPDPPRSPDDARARTLAHIVRRRGQEGFRATLLREYQDRCAITGEQARAVLEAAHIEPYMGDQSNTANNGLLLRADIHTLFDLHLIGVDDTRCVVVSKSLKGASYDKLDGRAIRRTRTKRAAPSARRLSTHLSKVQEQGNI